jgi:CTP synthase (UTP-ammonia lyase)
MNMRKVSYMAVCTGLLAVICIAQDVVSVVHGTVTKVDSTTKTVVVKSADGTEHAIKVTGGYDLQGSERRLRRPQDWDRSRGPHHR